MRRCLRSMAVLFCALATSTRADVVIDFQDLTVPAGGYFNGDPGGMPTATPWYRSVPWTSGSVEFANAVGRDVGESGGMAYNYTYWSGFAYSNVADTTDFTFTNQYAAFPGGGVGGPGTTYAIAYSDGDPANPVTLRLPIRTTVAGFRIANTTYAYGIMAGPDPNNFGSPLFPDGWFATTATGKRGTTTTSSATFYLADLRGSSPPGILTTWAWFDLSSLGMVDRIEFTFDGSDKHPIFGLNTPRYFAMDDLTVTAVPEPTTATLLTVAAVAAAGDAVRRWRRRSHAG